MNKREREKEIIRLLHRFGVLSIQELSNLLSASPSSVRRDLVSLSEHRFVTRTHGGVQLSTAVDYSPSWIHRTPVAINEARAIAQEAAKLIQPGDIIGISGGEVCTQLALLTRLMENITVVTNAINVAAELVNLPLIQVRLTGGRLNTGSFELVGSAIESSIRGVHIQKFFLGTDGVSVQYGVTGHDEAEAATAAVIMGHSDETIVLADSGKFKRTSFSQVAPITEFGAIISTELVPKNVRTEFQKVGVRMILAADF